ncbi:MAG: zinc ribbon domain-containing protein [Candidatus Aminicenantes bacterium]|nr:zinc ribbon domain-containing protein [Candidatus Aminicenantes bacterium]
MPIYEFCCSACGKKFESLVRLGGEKDVACAFCGARDVRKLLSAFGIGGGASRLKASSSGCSSCASHSCSTCH